MSKKRSKDMHGFGRHMMEMTNQLVEVDQRQAKLPKPGTEIQMMLRSQPNFVGLFFNVATESVTLTAGAAEALAHGLIIEAAKARALAQQAEQEAATDPHS